MQQEEWRSIEGCTGFEVSNTGKIRATDRTIYQVSRNGKRYSRVIKGHLIPPHIDFGGYQICSVSINNKSIDLKVHRVVAQAFIPNPNDYPQVNHIDGNKKNNAVTNLEWCTPEQNQQHALRIGLRKKKKQLKYETR